MLLALKIYYHVYCDNLRKIKKLSNNKNKQEKNNGKTRKKAIATESAPAAIGPYSQGITAGNLIISSGQLPADPKTGEIKGDITEQTKQSFN